MRTWERTLELLLRLLIAIQSPNLIFIIGLYPMVKIKYHHCTFRFWRENSDGNSVFIYKAKNRLFFWMALSFILAQSGFTMYLYRDSGWHKRSVKLKTNRFTPVPIIKGLKIGCQINDYLGATSIMLRCSVWGKISENNCLHPPIILWRKTFGFSWPQSVMTGIIKWPEK